jgi:predicted nucleic acid-binding protein
VIVLDASAAVDALLDTPLVADRVHGHLLEHEGDLHAPHLIDAEVGQVLRRYVLGRQLAPARADRAIERLRSLGITRYAHLFFLPRAMHLHRNLTVYDALYVALAEALGAPLLTRDAKLARSAGRLVEVIHVG